MNANRRSLAIVISFALGACTNENDVEPPIVEPPYDFGDAGYGCAEVGKFSDLSFTSCNPVTQRGCCSGEKCGELTIVKDDPATQVNEFLAQIACVPEGDVTDGGACETGLPGQQTGYDDCVAGYDCFEGVCRSLCGSSPDTCHTDSPSFGMGQNCANNFEDHFNDTVGVCLAACDPTIDTIETSEGSDPAAVNPTCGIGASCGLNAFTAQTSCSGTPAMSVTQTQNEVPFGQTAGQSYATGCASGFSSLLWERVGANGGEPQCARYCTPRETYLDVDGIRVIGRPEGANAKCSDASLAAIGGKAGHDKEHQCRFIQNLYPTTELVPASVGMCMPVESRGGTFILDSGLSTNAPTNTWGNCRTFAWGEIKASWNAAAPNGIDAANAAFDAVCISLPNEPGARFLQKCIGFFYGCISLEEESSLDTPAGSTAVSGGQLLRDRFKITREVPAQLEEPGL